MPDAELVAKLPVPSECVRRIRWLLGDIGLRAESVVAHALDEHGQHVEAWEPSCTQIVVNIALKVSPADAEVLTAALEWAGLVAVTCTSKGFAGTSGRIGDQSDRSVKVAADDQAAPRPFYVAGTIVGPLPDPTARPPVAAGEPVMGWALLPPPRTRIPAGTEVVEQGTDLDVIRECEKCREQLAGWRASGYVTPASGRPPTSGHWSLIGHAVSVRSKLGASGSRAVSGARPRSQQRERGAVVDRMPAFTCDGKRRPARFTNVKEWLRA
jgi:hypothetical protein